MPLPLQPWAEPDLPPQEAESSTSRFNPRGEGKAPQHWGDLGCLYGQLNQEIHLDFFFFATRKLLLKFTRPTHWIKSLLYAATATSAPGELCHFMQAMNWAWSVHLLYPFVSRPIWSKPFHLLIFYISFVLSSWTLFSTFLRFCLQREAMRILT